MSRSSISLACLRASSPGSRWPHSLCHLLSLLSKQSAKCYHVGDTLRWNKYSVCPHDKHGSVASGCLQTPPCSSPQRPGYILQRHQCSWTPVRPGSGAVKPLRTEIRWAGCREECCCVPCICFPDYSTEGLGAERCLSSACYWVYF